VAATKPATVQQSSDATTQQQQPAAVAPTQAPAAEAQTQPVTTAAVAESVARKFKPIWGPNFQEGDGRGQIVCGAYAFSADYVLQQIQVQGLDIKRGFHLGIVPFYLNDNYVVTAQERTDAVRSGELDCLLTTFDLIALEDPGVVTAIINESAGGDAIWSRDVRTLNDLKGKRIAFEANGPSEYFVLDLLATVGLSPKDVQLLPQPNQDVAIGVFNNAGADVVAGWEPKIFEAERSGGQLLASSQEFRSILGGIVMSQQALTKKRTVVQLFHDAWFEAMALQENDFDKAAASIAAWGNNDYLGVQKESAADDLRGLLRGVAQASLADNVRSFTDVKLIIDRLLQARKLWAEAGHPIPTSAVTEIVDPEFVRVSGSLLQVDVSRVNTGLANNSFSMARPQIAIGSAPATAAGTAVTNTTSAEVAAPAAPAPSATTATTAQQDALSTAQTVATLPCSRFEFVPNTTQLQPNSQQELRDCAVRVLQQNATLFVRVKGSSAWPGPPGTYTQQQVESTAKARAQSVIDFLVGQGLSKDRFVLVWTLPPDDHRETTDVTKQSQDRYVELTLLVAGL
jgi:ABC-type nitrate/sulfonate/bicarbonate transport system substrate-binding protein